MLNKGIASGLEFNASKQTLLPLYFDIIHSIDFIPVELITIHMIQELQKAGVIVMGLTARSIAIIDRTIAQLRALGIDLSHAALWHEPIMHDCHLPYCYKNGILFCDGNDKGVILDQVLTRLNYTPTKIVVIDDKEKHLHAIARVLGPEIEFVGIRYSYLDEKVRNFDPLCADEELLEWIMWHWLFCSNNF